MRGFRTRRAHSSHVRQQPIPSVHETGSVSYIKWKLSFPMLFRLLSRVTGHKKNSPCQQSNIKLSHISKCSLGLLLVLLVYLMTCITEDSIWLCITENLPNNNNFNKRCLILELGSPPFIRWFYEYSGSQAPSRSLLYHPYDPIWLLILQPLYPHSR